MPGTYVNHNEPADPLDRAMQPPEPGRFWGQVKDIEIFEIGFKKKLDNTGQPIVIAGKTQYERPTPYDPDYHDFSSDQIKFTLLPLDATRPIKELEAGINNRKNPEFRRIIQPSILKLGEKICLLRNAPIEGANFFRLLIGLYIHGEYVRRPWNKDGEDWTTLEFRDVFATESECQAHQNAMRAENGDAPLPFPGDTPQVTQTAPQADPMRATMANFLPALWDTSGKNPVQFLSALAQNPMLAKHFTAASPEVQAVLAQANVENETPF